MEWSVAWDIVGRLAVAGLLGAVMGLERELDDHPAGLRTFMTVAVGAALFGVVSTVGFDEFRDSRADTNVNIEVTRVASQVVVGIGFLGAGLIFRRGDDVMNLTTAASLWTTAAIGLAAGIGNAGIALAATVIIGAILFLVPGPKRWLIRRFGRSRRTIDIRVSPDVRAQELRRDIEAIPGVTVEQWAVEKESGDIKVQCHVSSRNPDELEDHIGDLAASELVKELRRR